MVARVRVARRRSDGSPQPTVAAPISRSSYHTRAGAWRARLLRATRRILAIVLPRRGHTLRLTSRSQAAVMPPVEQPPPSPISTGGRLRRGIWHARRYRVSFRQNLIAERHALGADIHTIGPRDDTPGLLAILAAERALIRSSLARHVLPLSIDERMGRHPVDHTIRRGHASSAPDAHASHHIVRRVK